MPTRYASLSSGARCSDLSERDLIAALISRDECGALLKRIGELPSARSTSRALLALLGRLATPACTWLEGALAVELFEEDGGTKIRVMSEIGAGLRERVVPVVTVAQPLAELVGAFEKRRDLMMVLRLERISSRCAMLCSSTTDDDSAPMSTEFDISETSLAWAPSEDVDSGWDS
jgi:hypothetical protein